MSCTKSSDLHCDIWKAIQFSDINNGWDQRSYRPRSGKIANSSLCMPAACNLGQPLNAARLLADGSSGARHKYLVEATRDRLLSCFVVMNEAFQEEFISYITVLTVVSFTSVCSVINILHTKPVRLANALLPHQQGSQFVYILLCMP